LLSGSCPFLLLKVSCKTSNRSGYNQNIFITCLVKNDVLYIHIGIVSIMKISIEPIKTTIIGGIVFLVPIVIVTAIVGKALQLMMVVAEPVDKVIPIETIAGVAVVNILAILAILVFCFFAGLAARSVIATKIGNSINALLLNVIPGYAFVKGITDTLSSNTRAAEGFTPVLVRLDDYSQMGFEVERLPGNLVVVYMPGAPNPWSGTVGYFNEDRVQQLDLPIGKAIKNIQQLGRGSAMFSDRLENVLA